MLFKALIHLYIWFLKVFKGKSYSCRKISQAYFIVDHGYDRIIRDYYKYIEYLLSQALVLVDTPCVVLLDCSGFAWLNFFVPIKKVAFQIEHTLVKRDARDCEDAIPGRIAIPGSFERYLVRLAKFSKLQRSDVVIEYSQINQFNVRQNPELTSYASKAFCISPALYPLLENSPTASSPRMLNTITMFSNPDEPRRKRFLNTLATSKVDSQNINNVFDGIEDLYRSTMILINIRQTDHHDTLEELRVLPALRSGVIVISERAPLIEKTRYSKYIIWGDLDELPALVVEIQKNYQFWHEKIFDNPGFVRRMKRISRRNELVSLRVVQFLNAL